MRNWMQGVAQLISAVGAGGWNNVANNLSTRSALDAGNKTGDYMFGAQAPPQGQSQQAQIPQPAAQAQGNSAGNIRTASITPDAVNNASAGANASAGNDYYKDQIKRSENEPLFTGKQTTSKAQWDYKLHTNGFGTRAQSPGEVIDAPTAHARFDDEWNKANAQVKARYPNLDQGTENAITSLTLNGGQGIMQGKD